MGGEALKLHEFLDSNLPCIYFSAFIAVYDFFALFSVVFFVAKEALRDDPHNDC